MFHYLNFYIDFKWDDYADDQDNYFGRINKIIKVAYQHKLNVFYNPEQLQTFKANCNDWDDGFITSKANYLSFILEEAFPINNQEYLFSVLFSQENTSLLPITNSIAEFFHKRDKISLLSLSEKGGKRNALMVKSNDEFEKIEYTILNTVEDIADWIWKNSEIRSFNLSQKHGENGIGHWQDALPLLCSKDRAQELLNKSIGDFRVLNRLFIFDEGHDTFLEFFYEGDNPQKQWHGFHITQNDWQIRVPKSVRNFYGKY